MKEKVKFTQLCIEHGPGNDINYLWALDTDGQVWYRKAITDSKWSRLATPMQGKVKKKCQTTSSDSQTST